MNKVIIFFSTIVFASFMLASCGSGNKKNNKSDDYSRTEILKNWADNIIIPSYQEYLSQTKELVDASTAFTETPNVNNLMKLRDVWETAYLGYQRVAIYGIAKAKSENFVAFMNTYPVSTKIANPTQKYTIDNNIAKEDYNFKLLSQRKNQGFGALDYLLNGIANKDEDIVNIYKSSDLGGKYKKYLIELVNRIYTLSSIVANNWNEGFRKQFIENDGNSASSSIDMLTNSMLKYFEEHIREAKLATPSGVRFSGKKNPLFVEAYYKKDISKKLFLAAFLAVRDFYDGKAFNKTTKGESFRSYLLHLKKDKLVEKIDKHFQMAISDVEKLNDNFIQQIEADNDKMKKAFDSVQSLVRFLKTDMTYAFNIQITYQDADGD